MINIGLLGLGTVGGSVVKNFNKYIDPSMAVIKKILVNDIGKKRDIDLGGIKLTEDPNSILDADDIHLVVELIGGEHPALEYILQAIENNKAIITANKAVLALHGDRIFSAGLKKKLPISIEASVGGGIPIITSMLHSYHANNIRQFIGICNGTSNYILSKMALDKISFSDALEQAKKLGYAEADPTADISGFDSACKCNIMATLSFKLNPLEILRKEFFDKIYYQGINNIDQIDLELADSLDYVIKAIIYGHKIHNKIYLGTFPALIKKNNLLANINGVDNIFQITSDLIENNYYIGPGAGGNATASSILSDVYNFVHHKFDQDYFYQLITNNSYTNNSKLDNTYSIENTEFRFFIILNIYSKQVQDWDNKIKLQIEKTAKLFNINFLEYNSEKSYIKMITDAIISTSIEKFFNALKESRDLKIIKFKYIRVLDV